MYYEKIILLISAVILTSCNSYVPKCSDELVVDKLKAMIVEDYDRKLSSSLLEGAQIFGNLEKDSLDSKTSEIENEIVEKNLEKKNNLKIINIITTEKNNDTKSCSCEATLDNVSPISIYLFEKWLENGQSINYSVKTIDDGQQLIEIEPIY